MTAFSVATISNEKPGMILGFVAWHLAQGAARVTVYLDDPEDPALPRLRGDPRVDPVPCTPAFWNSLGLAPDGRFTRRQRAVLNRSYGLAETPWLLVLDADERMWIRGGEIPSLLGGQPDDALSVRVRSAETVALADGARGLRLPIPREVVNRVYGPEADLFRRRSGLVGHPEGKAFHRTGLAGANVKLHWAEDADGAPLPGPVLGPEDRVHLVHDVAPGYARWRAKLDWRVGAHGFSGPLKDRIARIAATPDPEAGYRALYDRLHRLGAAEAAALAAAGGLLREMPAMGLD